MDAFGKEIDTGDAATGVDGATAEVVLAGMIGADDWGGVLTGIVDTGAAVAILLIGEVDVAAGIEETAGVVAGVTDTGYGTETPVGIAVSKAGALDAAGVCCAPPLLIWLLSTCPNCGMFKLDNRFRLFIATNIPFT